jgi:beta-N-acetylglucosaminidase
MKKKITNRILSIIFCSILILNLLMPIKLNANTYTQYKKTGISEFPTTYQEKLNQLYSEHPKWTFTAYYTGISWDEFISQETSVHLRNTVINSSDSLWKDSCEQTASGYACASTAILKYYSDPRNFISESGIFQFLEMTYNSSSQNEEGVKSIIASTFMNTNVTFELNGSQTTMNYSQIIMEAAKQSNMSPYSIAIKIIQEVGTNGSSSVSGNYTASDGTNYSGYYNFFNYGAYDTGDAIANGLKYAKDKGWTNQYIAIVEGAKLMATSYTNAGQNTAYFYKWDVVGTKTSELFSHQYMTNIQDPSSQAKNLFNTYAKNNLLDCTLNFIIPVFNDMPQSNNIPTTIDVTASSSYYLTGSSVRVRSNASTSGSVLSTLDKDVVVTLLEWNVGTSNGYDWAKIQLSNGTVGYIANKYLAKCNSNNISNSSIAKIDENYLIALPEKSVSQIASSLGASSFSVTKSDNSLIGNDEKLGTNYKYKINENEYTVVILGDVYADGTITSKDYMKIKNYIMGTNSLNEAELKAADVYKDNSINSKDYMKIKNYIMGTSSISIE